MATVPADQYWALQLDFSNAFNSISGVEMFAEFGKHLFSLSPWIESCYSDQLFLLLGLELIHSCSGVQQGDLLGPLAFALTLQPIVTKIQAEIRGLGLNAWYLDDGTLIGSPKDLVAPMVIVEKEENALGLNLNSSKSVFFIPQESDSSCSLLPPDIPIT